MWIMNSQTFKLILEKAEEPEIKLPTSTGSLKKQESSRKTSISALLTMPKPLTVWITVNCGKFSRRWEYWTTWPASWETCIQVRKEQLEIWQVLISTSTGRVLKIFGVEKKKQTKKRTGHGKTDWLQIGKGVHQGCILSPCLFNLYALYIMRNAGLEEAQAGIKIAGRIINNLR